MVHSLHHNLTTSALKKNTQLGKNVFSQNSLQNTMFFFNIFGLFANLTFATVTVYPRLQYKWTTCMLLVVVHRDSKNFEVNQIFYPTTRELTLVYSPRDMEFFLFYYKPATTSTNLEVSGVDYICRFCIMNDTSSDNDTLVVHFQIPCKTTKCRLEMEREAKERTLDGKHIPCHVTSSIAPYENLVGEVNDPRRKLKTKGRLPPTIFLFTQDKAFEKLVNMSFRNYYFLHRKRINFIRVNQGILFEEVPKNISEKFFGFPNKDIESFNPTAHNSESQPNFIADDNIKFLRPGIQYDMKMDFTDPFPYNTKTFYPTAENYFNFLTCHGIYKIAPLTTFLDPFEFQVWITILIVLLCIVLIFIISLLKDGFKLIQTLSILETLTLYSISVVLENGFEKLKNRERFSKFIAKLVFLILAFMCVILGCLYKSSITADIIKPIPVTIPYKNYSHLQNFELVAMPAKDLLALPRLAEKSRRPKSVRNGNIVYNVGPQSFGLGEYIGVVNFFLSEVEKETEAERVEKEKLKFYYDEILRRVRLFEYEEDALEWISNCNKKKAFVGSAEEIEEFLTFNKQKVNLRKGRDKFLTHSNSWQIPQYAGGFVHRRMAQLISSGIYHIWEEVFYTKTRDELDISLKKTIEVKQSLDTNLGVLFKITGLGLAAGTFVFCIEIVISMVPKPFRIAYGIQIAVISIKLYAHALLQILIKWCRIKITYLRDTFSK